MKCILLFCFLFLSLFVIGQDTANKKTGLQFSGVIKINTNGISSVPAFSLDKPAINGTLSLAKNRFRFDQEIAFSMEGIPWFLESYFRYKVVDGKKFNFTACAMWGIGYSYSEVMLDEKMRAIAKAQRYVFLQFTPSWYLSEKVSVNLITYHGYGFVEGSILML